MAKRIPNSCDGLSLLDKMTKRVDTVTGEVVTATYDEITHEKLDAILAALGGSADTTPTIFNLNIINQGTEYSQALPANTKAFLLRSRNKGRLRLAYTMGGTSANYITIPTGSSFKDTNFYTSVTVYVQSTKPGDIVEIIAYT